MSDPGGEERAFAWVAFGSRSEPPSRLEIVSCPGCAALVASERVEVHLAWHRRLHSETERG
jgi:hypothetical protein